MRELLLVCRDLGGGSIGVPPELLKADSRRMHARSLAPLQLGLAAAAFFAIPIVGWLAFPFGVAGATRLAMLDRRGTPP